MFQYIIYVWVSIKLYIIHLEDAAFNVRCISFISKMWIDVSKEKSVVFLLLIPIDPKLVPECCQVGRRYLAHVNIINITVVIE